MGPRPRDLASPLALVRSSSAGTVAAVATLAICAGFIGVACGAIGAVLLVALCIAATRSLRVRGFLDRESALNARASREAQRRRSLGGAAGDRREQYVVLLAIVGEIERLDAVEAERLELQDLLDHFVQLCVAHQHCVESLGICGGLDSCDAASIPGWATARRREIAARRLRLHAECARRLARIADEIACTDGFIRLVGQRAAVAELDGLGGGATSELERRLSELDNVEAALDEISA